MAEKTSWRIGVDVGGTFTDMVLVDDQSVMQTFKVPSVPEDPSRGVMNVLAFGASSTGIPMTEMLGRCKTFIHGSTVATNTMLEGKGARVALLTTHGFRDSLEIRRGHRKDVWNHREPFSPVLVPRYLRFAIAGRMDWRGREIEPLREADVEAAVEAALAHDIEAMCVAFLHSYANSEHETRAVAIIEDALAAKGRSLAVCASSRISSAIGEYGRTSTVVLNGYLMPRVSGYLMRLKDALAAEGLRSPLLMQQSNGGAISVDQAAASPTNLLLSGPSGVIGALNYLAGAYGDRNLVSVEIGGTSTDVTLLDNGAYAVSEHIEVAGYPAVTSAIDIHTVAAGGGSIAGVDAAGMMHVGPEGAGASPGPAAFGRGGDRPTVTDAHLYLGRLKPGSYANGHVNLDMAQAKGALTSKLDEPLKIATEESATGIILLANQHIKHAVERISVERGVDIRKFALVAGGGAGPMHGVSVARSLGMTKVIVPRQSGALCAFGLLNGDVRQDFPNSCLETLDGEGLCRVKAILDDRVPAARNALKAQGFGPDQRSLAREINLRYRGQQWDIRIALDAEDDATTVRAKFEESYGKLYGHIQPDGQIEICGASLTAFGHLDPIEPKRVETVSGNQEAYARRRVHFEGRGWCEDVPIFAGATLSHGFRTTGPAIVEESTTTIVVGPGDGIEMSEFGDYLITVAQEVRA